MISADGFTADVSLSYRGQENTMNSEHCCGALGIQSWDGNAWDPPIGIGTGTTSSIGTVTAMNVTSFGNWVITSNSSPLPIELTEFNAVIRGDQVDVDWKLAAEINVDYFNVERSADGIIFESIAQVKGKGNTDMGSHYNVTDKHPLNGISYYRLKQTNFNGKNKYSETRVVNFRDLVTGILTVKDFGPNPFDNSFWVVYEVSKNGPVSFQLTDAAGKVIHTDEMNAQEGLNRYEFTNQTRMERGICFLNIRYNGQLTVKKFLKK